MPKDEITYCPHCNAPGRYSFGGFIFGEVKDGEFKRHDCIQYLRRRVVEEQEQLARTTSDYLNAVRALPARYQDRTTLADAIRAMLRDHAAEKKNVFMYLQENHPAIKVLQELVTLHDHVKYDNPEDYERRRPLAWQSARKIVEKYTSTENRGGTVNTPSKGDSSGEVNGQTT